MANFRFLVLHSLRLESVRPQNFETLVQDSDTGGPNSNTVSQDRIRICFSKLIVRTLYEKTNEGETKNIIFVLALFLSSFILIISFLKI